MYIDNGGKMRIFAAMFAEERTQNSKSLLHFSEFLANLVTIYISK